LDFIRCERSFTEASSDPPLQSFESVNCHGADIKLLYVWSCLLGIGSYGCHGNDDA